MDLWRIVESDQPSLFVEQDYWLGLGFDAEQSSLMTRFTHGVGGSLWRFDYGHGRDSIRVDASGDRYCCITPGGFVVSNSLKDQGHLYRFWRDTLSMMIMPHHESLLPHWTAIASQIRDHDGLEGLSIYGIELPSDVLRVLAPAMHESRRNLQTLKLCGNNLGRDGFVSVSNLIREFAQLKKLRLSRNEINDLASAEGLFLAIKNHPSLELMDLSRCGIGIYPSLLKSLSNIGLKDLYLSRDEIPHLESAEAMSLALRKNSSLEILNLTECGLGNSPQILQTLFAHGCSLKVLRLINNNIGSSATNIIADFIGSNPILTKLSLRGNNLLDSDAGLLAEALKKNTNLRTLNLRSNQFSPIGMEPLMKVVYDDSSLDRIAASHHSCRLYLCQWVSQQDVWNNQILRVNEAPEAKEKLKIRYKVFASLCTMRNGEGKDDQGNYSLIDLQFLDSVPTKLIPYFFFLITEDRSRFDSFLRDRWNRERMCLSDVFNAMRYWKSPHLRSFVNLNYLDGLPLNFMPFVLELIQKPVNYHHLFGDENYSQSRPQTHEACLSRIFHVVRVGGWRTPVLFGKRECSTSMISSRKRKVPE